MPCLSFSLSLSLLIGFLGRRFGGGGGGSGGDDDDDGGEREELEFYYYRLSLHFFYKFSLLLPHYPTPPIFPYENTQK